MTEKPPSWQRWLVLGMALLGMGITFSLGMWQLGRAAEKTALQDAREQQAEKPVLDGRSLGQASAAGSPTRADLIHRKMALTGRWLPQKTVYLKPSDAWQTRFFCPQATSIARLKCGVAGAAGLGSAGLHRSDGLAQHSNP